MIRANSNRWNSRIKKLTSEGKNFMKLVGIHLSALPEAQTFLDQVTKQYPDIEILKDSEVNQARDEVSMSTWTCERTGKSRAVIHSFATKLPTDLYPPGCTIDVEGNEETGSFRVNRPRFNGDDSYLIQFLDTHVITPEGRRFIPYGERKLTEAIEQLLRKELSLSLIHI